MKMSSENVKMTSDQLRCKYELNNVPPDNVVKNVPVMTRLKVASTICKKLTQTGADCFKNINNLGLGISRYQVWYSISTIS